MTLTLFLFIVDDPAMLTHESHTFLCMIEEIL